MGDGSHGGEKDISGWSSWTREIIAKGGHSPREIFEKKKAKRVEEGARAMSQKAYYINRLEEEKNRVARGEYESQKCISTNPPAFYVLSKKKNPPSYLHNCMWFCG